MAITLLVKGPSPRPFYFCGINIVISYQIATKAAF